MFFQSLKKKVRIDNKGFGIKTDIQDLVGLRGIWKFVE